MSTTTLRSGQVVPVQEAHSLAPSWGVSCPYCGARNDIDAGAHGPYLVVVGDLDKCGACDGEYVVPLWDGALSLKVTNMLREEVLKLRLMREAIEKGHR